MKKIRVKMILTFVFAISTSLILAAATFGQRADDLLPPEIQMAFASQPAPIPVPSEGRVPASLRLATSIEMEDGSHPPPATELRFALDRQFRLALADVPTCPSGVRSQSRTGESPCPESRVASGRSKWDVAFPEREPIQVEGRTVVYKVDSRKLAFRTFLPAPVTAEIATLVELSRAPKGSRYGLLATASLPKVAGGHGSLVDLGLRFRKGLFSVACPQRKLQSRLAIRFADGTLVSATSATAC